MEKLINYEDAQRMVEKISEKIGAAGGGITCDLLFSQAEASTAWTQNKLSGKLSDYSFILVVLKCNGLVQNTIILPEDVFYAHIGTTSCLTISANPDAATVCEATIGRYSDTYVLVASSNATVDIYGIS